ncbi:diguanylate cyclase [Serpentinicella alkaliphila]|uniref:Diguanylate cyclase n=1 Tax=Serpentinicella alkaliphila TaxID=1734049 RepID=A0A4R2TK84_9FIRM|nr:diguanylate cyclase [Serpentinicella alkaliphila]QUH25482.1 diguanylate cyclase [Serpentinicella alkaliphila]TCQ01595.1 diguanylate cyclase [Serpentinicella alkaliphila]
MINDLLLNSTIIVTFISLGNQFYVRENGITESSSISVKTMFGVSAGVLGCILMLNSVVVVPTVILDFRNIAIILSSIFAGPIASIITSIIIGVFRVIYFGTTTSSITALIIAIVMGIGCPIFGTIGISMRQKWMYKTVFCTIIGSLAYIFLVKNTIILLNILCAYWIGNSLIAILLYDYTNYLMISNEIYTKYKEESLKDFLTGLNNVRQFDKAFNSITSRISERGEYLSLLFIDIDFFKKVNDTYGHTEGDKVLQELGKVLLKTCGDFGIVSRNGGEEFSVMLVGCLPQQAINIAERVRTTVEKHQFTLTSGEMICITISIGVATYPQTTKDFSKLTEEADKALYKAKQTGRNKVVYLANNYEKEEHTLLLNRW